MGARLIGAIIGGAVAGAIGGAVWAGMSYGTGYEIGWIAWGVGALVGFGVAAGGRMGGPVAGLVAVLMSVLSILGGRYAVVQLIIQNEMGDTSALADEMLGNMDEETVISYIADQVHEERTEQGETFQWPEGVDPDEATTEEEYPPELWADAKARWDALSPADQVAYRENLQVSLRRDFEAAMDTFRGEFAKQGFVASFDWIDLLFFGLAIVTAWQIAYSGRIGQVEV